jgi:hypothetical protein
MAVGIPDLLLVIIGGCLTLLGVIVQSWISQSQFLEQRSRPAMRKLFLLVTDRNVEPEKWAEAILQFLNTFEASFIPNKIQQKTINLVYEMGDKYAETYPNKGRKFTDADAQKIIEDWEKDYSSMSKQERAETDFGGWLLQNKVELGKTILKEISGQKPPEEELGIIS